MRSTITIGLVLLVGCASAPPVRLRRVVLYQSGVGYFEREGAVQDGEVHLSLSPHEVDDVLTTLTVIDPEHPEDVVSPSVVVPREPGDGPTILALRLGARPRPLTVTYAAPTAAWRASYRVVLPEARDSDDAWFQAWAVVDNSSQEDWEDIDLTLATDAPLSFAVNLRTPRIVERPSVAGYHAPPIAFGPVMAEHSTRGDRDGDGLPDIGDRCPDTAEDFDSYEDVDGCPDADHDADAILDVDDQCPDDPETYNGLEDVDGCPDVGRVVVSSSDVTIMESIFFDSGQSALLGASGSVLDAVASALRAHPEITTVEVRGHADPSEPTPYALAAERAVVVRMALEERGVAAERLATIPLGDSQPLSASDPAQNRRADFRLRDAEAPSPSRGAVQRTSIERSRTTRELPAQTGSGTRFPVARGVRVPAGQSAMVAILESPLHSREVLLYRVGPAVPSSQRHPFRAARLENESGVDLVAGPVSIFQSGELVGEGMLGALAVGQNAFVPYAVDATTSVSVRSELSSEPSRVLSIERGRVRVERVEVARSFYDLELGARVPARIYVRHARRAGYAPHDLPPGSETSPDALLVALSIAPSTEPTLTVDERRVVPGVFDLADPRSGDLRPYLAGSDLSAADDARLRQVLDDRDALIRMDEEMTALRAELTDAARRTAELRRTLTSLDERAGRSVSPVRRRVADQLADAVDSAERLGARLAARGVEALEARIRLREAAEALTLVPTE